MPVYIDLSQIKNRLKLNGQAQTFLVSTIQKHMDKYIPKNNGDLRREHTKTLNTLTYEMPYAEIQYYGIIYGKPIPEGHYTTPGTGPYWEKRMLNNESETIKKELVNFINRKG